MMKQIAMEELGRAAFQNEAGEENQLKYFKVIYQQPNEESLHYGICVEKLKDDVVLQSEESGAFSDNLNFIENTINALKDNTITPYTLCEVLDDMLDD